MFKQILKSNLRKTWVACVRNEGHVPVMVEEAIENLKVRQNQIIIDMTFGAGGHSTKILESSPNVTIVALDRDPIAYNLAKNLSIKYPNQVIPLLGRFSDLPELFRKHKIRQNSIDGILFDFGCSSMQFDTPERGFSVSKNGPLDMRMDLNPDNPTAADVLSYMDEEDLAKIIKIYGEEKHAKKIARAIIEARYSFKKLQTTEELALLVDSVCSEEHRIDKLQRFSHTATKTFQALRIFVNNEINEINYGMVLAQKFLKIGGRLVAISFHSLEDTVVKRHIYGNVIDNAINSLPLKYSDYSKCHDKTAVDSIVQSNWVSLHKQVLTPSYEEVETNPRSRSAKLRAAVRVN